MEEVLLEAEEEIKVPSMQEFRGFVDQQSQYWRKRDEIYVKLSYLLASRASELLCKVTPYMLQHNMTKPYGKLLQYDVASYKKFDGKTVRILLVKSAVAKKHKTQRKAEPLSSNELSGQAVQTEESNSETSPQVSPQVQKVKMKIVPIVCDPDAEPWCVDILKWIQFRKGIPNALSFDMCEMTAQNIVKKTLSQLNPKIHPHLLRHYRVTHLRKNYRFDPYELSAFTGWSIQSSFAQKGQITSSMVDRYVHTDWTEYVEKLLIPIQDAY